MPLALNSPVNKFRRSACMPWSSLLALCIVHRLFTRIVIASTALRGSDRFYLSLFMIITFCGGVRDLLAYLWPMTAPLSSSLRNVT